MGGVSYSRICFKTHKNKKRKNSKSVSNSKCWKYGFHCNEVSLLHIGTQCAPPAEAGSWSPESLACVRSPAAVPYSDAAPPPHSDWSDFLLWFCEVTQYKQNSLVNNSERMCQNKSIAKN